MLQMKSGNYELSHINAAERKNTDDDVDGSKLPLPFSTRLSFIRARAGGAVSPRNSGGMLANSHAVKRIEE